MSKRGAAMPTADPTATSTDVELIDSRTRARALMGSAIGSAVEWYDYFLYGTLAGIVFGPLFFPSDDPLTSARQIQPVEAFDSTSSVNNSEGFFQL
jgi:hypothetical protein